MGGSCHLPPTQREPCPEALMMPPSPPWADTALTTPPCADLLLEEENCADDLDGELDGLWTTISIFITLFLLSVCYSATVTLFKVGGHPAGPRAPSVPRIPAESLSVLHCPSLSTHSLLTALGEAHVGSSLCSPCPPTGEMDLLLGGGAEEDDRPRLQKHARAGRLELLWVESRVAQTQLDRVHHLVLLSLRQACSFAL